ncbi:MULTISPECIES: hypothetical protein [Pelosinus]|uniref:Uncharacterized protein n=1 Tax=Pelosinus fermentans B4 TaxID=1149862 RepID=I8RI55_9FIRM|nr:MULTISPECIES: hypothetical protein [Pelosinus]EIW19508.1 hypothetical protein FB4_2691 [Pelosinus fermentans B4]EIW24759.1 hypothetical protein FA11_3150 [Pelosinus fermentans A11]OAM95960.1 hypothetical protein FR7_03982 [Pelosinus fermentans DSM 17108]SDR34776.1 hypothetical protein SAMN04515679_4150 [Pelosinus fermentans]
MKNTKRDTSKGAWLFVDGVPAGKFIISVSNNGNKATYPGTYELEETIILTLQRAAILGIPEDHIIYDEAGIEAQAGQSALCRMAVEGAKRGGFMR